MLVSLRELSEFIPSGGNDLAGRRQLQHRLEAKDLAHCKELLAKFSMVKCVLDKTAEALDDLEKDIHRASERVEAARKSTGALVEQAAKMETQRTTIQEKSRVVDKLLRQFQLDPKHSLALEGSEVDEDFLDAIRRVNEIRDNCHKLLQSYQRVGLEMVESLAKRQERAYQKLFNWTQRQIPKQANTPPEHQVNETFVKALLLLRHRPAYFSHCFDMLADARRVVLIKRFIAALCRGGPNGQPRPIEIHAGEPLRYVSDMLAWVHQALAMEREFLVSVISPDTLRLSLRQRRNSSASLDSKENQNKYMYQQQDEEEADKLKTFNSYDSKDAKEDLKKDSQLLAATSRVVEGIGRPLCVRVEHSLVFQPSVVLSYKLKSVLAFYLSTLSPLVEPEGVFCQALKGLVTKAQATFEKLVDAQVTNIIDTPAPYTNDLSPPSGIQSLIEQIAALIKVFEGTLVGSLQERDGDSLVPILSKLLSTIQDAADSSAKGLSKGNSSVFKLNILCALEGALQSSEPAIRQVAGQVSLEIKSRIQGLIKAQGDAFLAKSGLLETVRKLAEWQKDESETDEKEVQKQRTRMVEVPGLDESSLVSTLSAFYGYLVGVTSLLTPEMDRVADPWIRVTVREGVGLIVSEAYSSLDKSIRDPLLGYSEQVSARMLKHSPEQIRTLLDV